MTDGEGLTGCGDDVAFPPRYFHRQIMNLLRVDYVLVVEINILRMQTLSDRVMQGVGRLGHLGANHRCEMRHRFCLDRHCVCTYGCRTETKKRLKKSYLSERGGGVGMTIGIMVGVGSSPETQRRVSMVQLSATGLRESSRG